MSRPALPTRLRLRESSADRRSAEPLASCPANGALGFQEPRAYPLRMQSFIDLEGVSGARYRFQRVEDLASLPAIAGNYVYVRHNGNKQPVIVCCGADETLMRAASGWASAHVTHRPKPI
jgi:hypothetical protein